MNFFVTGTDTGVGKTYITALLTAYCHTQNSSTVPMKPVQTGCEEKSGELLSADLQQALAAAEIDPSDEITDLLVPARFKKPCSPHLAARLENRSVEVKQILQTYHMIRKQYDGVIVEGAGGIMVPLTEDYLMLDLMIDLQLPIILVARTDLGTINHTLLSIERLRTANLNLAGVIFNQLTAASDPVIRDDNMKIIPQLGRVPVLGYTPYREKLMEEIFQPGNLWRKIEGEIELRTDLLTEISSTAQGGH